MILKMLLLAIRARASLFARLMMCVPVSSEINHDGSRIENNSVFPKPGGAEHNTSRPSLTACSISSIMRRWNQSHLYEGLTCVMKSRNLIPHLPLAVADRLPKVHNSREVR